MFLDGPRAMSWRGWSSKSGNDNVNREDDPSEMTGIEERWRGNKNSRQSKALASEYQHYDLTAVAIGRLELMGLIYHSTLLDHAGFPGSFI